MNLTANNAPKDLQAECASRVIAHMKILILRIYGYDGLQINLQIKLELRTSSICQQGTVVGLNFGGTT